MGLGLGRPPGHLTVGDQTQVGLHHLQPQPLFALLRESSLHPPDEIVVELRSLASHALLSLGGEAGEDLPGEV